MAKTLPVMLLKRLILFPNQEIKLELNNSLSLKVLSLSEKKYNKEFVVVSPKDYLEEIPDVEDLPDVAVVAEIVRKIVLPNGQLRVTLIGKRRVKINKYFNPTEEKDLLECNYLVPEVTVDEQEEIPVKKGLIRWLRRYIKTSISLDNSFIQEINEKKSFKRQLS